VEATTPPPSGGFGWELGGHGFAAVSGDGASGGGALALGLGRRASGPAGELFFAGTGRRSVGIGAGQASFTRLVTGVGASWRFGWARAWPVDLGVHGLLAALLADGVGVPGARGGSAFDPGVGAQLRVGRRLGPALVQLSLGLWAWPRSQQLVIVGQTGTRELARVDGLFGVGVTFGNR
jgi:hypothetical protein